MLLAHENAYVQFDLRIFLTKTIWSSIHRWFRCMSACKKYTNVRTLDAVDHTAEAGCLRN